MTLRLTIFLLFILPFSLSAQKKMKFGKIPSEDLQMTVYEQDTSAAALILGERGNLFFDYKGQNTEIRLEVHRRIKIFKRAGFSQGDIAIHYYSQNNSSSVTNLKVKVFNPDGSNTSIPKGDIFKEQVSDYVSAKKFSVPNLTEGSIIDYQYTITTQNVFSLSRWSFQRDIPVRLSEYIVTIPKWYNYVNLKVGGPIQSDPPVKKVENISFNQGGGTKMGTTQVEFFTTRYYAENLPAMKEETYVTTMEDYLANIRFQLSKVEPFNKPVEYIMTSWDKVAAEIKDSKSFGRQYLKKNNYSKVSEAAQSTMIAATTEMDKMHAAYDFVLDNIEWNERYRMSVEESLNKVFEAKSGGSGEMNLMLLALLTEAGIKASPVLISTRDNGRPIDFYPILGQFNHVMVLAEIEEKKYYLDATEKNRPIGFPEVNSLNKKGWMIDEGQKWVDIETPKSGDVFMTNLTLDAEGSLTGDFSASSSGYSGFDEREIAQGDKEGIYWQKRLGEFNAEAEIQDISYEGMDKNDKHMKAKMTCSIPDAAQVSGDFIYFSPIVYSNFDENPFKLEKRLYPVDISHPFKEQLIINLTIPEGYAIEELPEQINLALPNKGGKYQYLISQQEDILQIIWKIDMKQLNFSPEEYKGVKNFFDMIMEKQGEQIVLKKV